jgi:fumarate hydratase class II
MNLKLDLDYKKYLPMLQKAEPYVFGIAMIAVFAYTAYVVNQALNVQPAAVAAPASGAAGGAAAGTGATAKITFDKKTIEAVKKLDVVEGNVPVGELGKDDPFK